jgi:uncharacterized phiE125 gp8 family phage protein
MISGEAVSPGEAAVAEARAYLRIEMADEDPLIERLLAGAMELCEQFTRQTLIARDFSETMQASSSWTRLGATPAISILAVEGLLPDGTAVPIAAGQHMVDIDASGDGWVRVTNAGEARRVRLSYRAGMGPDWAGLPEALRQGIVRLAAHFYTHRAAAEDEGPPAAVTALWRPWRRMRLG